MGKEFLLLSMFVFLLSSSIEAKVKLPHIISDNMVLQQKSKARFGGTTSPHNKVKGTVSWSDKLNYTYADDKGNWRIKVNTPIASFAEDKIIFDDGDTTVINHVQVGEVWVCAGQSNMEMPMQGWKGCPVEGYDKIVSDSQSCKGIRYCKIPSVVSKKPKDYSECKWEITTTKTVGAQSAIGYFFARLLTQKLNIPIGLIEANKGGTRVESWLNKESLVKYTNEPVDSAEIYSKISNIVVRPLIWGNGTFHPILNYSVKGILFNQGCANVNDTGDKYSERVSLLAKQWRHDFGLGNIPFYLVQIAPFFYGDAKNEKAARLREQQFLASQIIPNSAIVGTNDCVYPYEMEQVHPCQKGKVGKRLAFIALKRNYGFKHIDLDAPTFKSMKVSGDVAFLEFNHLDATKNNAEKIEGFEIAGTDKVFYKADAQFTHNGIRLTSGNVKQPKAV